MEAIILAGGLGTRLSSVVSDVPKCMAPVKGEPFQAYVLDYLENQGCDQVILSLGYKHEVVTDWLNSKAFLFKIKKVIEKEPLGTGGGIRLALNKSTEEQVFILNGDTMFNIPLKPMQDLVTANTKAVVALKPMQNFDRYGAVQLDNQKYITAFEEKQFKTHGLINGGIYLLNKTVEDLKSFPEKFSFEKDFLEKEAGNSTLKGYSCSDYFIDIGIPEDYDKAQREL